ncbi:MAG TPA: carboxypeptidase-like regulatory domain-containing protein [Polyangiaceae bacterium]|nr:carboxypeptidase-like regulatory domain-containing protein [Polyangiaceae bacterium]
MASARSLSQPSKPVWPLVLGAAFLGFTVLFLMGLILLSTAGHEVPCSSRFLVSAVLALTVAVGSSFLGGTAAARGQLPWKGAEKHPIRFAVTGGVAVFVITLTLGSQLYNGGADCLPSLPTVKPVKVTGRVLGEQGAPVAAARVSVTGVGARSTNSDGSFEIPVSGSSGPFSLSVYAPGYSPLTTSFELEGHDVKLADLQLGAQKK